MSVVNMVVGAATSDGATFVAKVDGGGPVRVAVADNEIMSGPVFTSSQAVDAQGVAKVSITGLDAATRHWWRIEDNGVIDTAVTGQFRTHPPAGLPASFTVGVASCAGGPASVPGSGAELAPSQVSDHPVFNTIRQRALAGDWLGFHHLGDLHYYHLGEDRHGIVGGGSLANYRRAYDDILLQARQHQLYREIPWSYTWDDNDFDGNNSDGTFAEKANALQVYGERVPHRSLDGSNGVYQSWQTGRILFIASDTRYLRSPNTDPDGPGKTMLGTAQKTWMEDILSTSGAEFLVWLMPSQWLHPSNADTWANFATERDELAALLGDTGWLGRMCMAYGDRHAIGIDSGAGNQWGGFPVLQAASLDSGPSGGDLPGVFDILPSTGGRGQYGTVEVTDLGSAISVRLAAWRGDTMMGDYALGVAVEQATAVASGALLRTLSGSHTPVFEARVVTGNPTGDDPAGIQIPILSGDVRYDATAQIWSSLELTTAGVDEDSGASLFPRLASDLLAPYGAEIWVRRGVDLGASILWTPLGFFRIETVAQDDPPFGPLRISGSDRMAGIVEAELVEQRVFAPTRTVGSVVDELVTDIYPDAVIVWDDSTNLQSLGRQMIAKQDRYGFLHGDLVEPLGKVIFLDGEGVWRIEDAPDPDEIVWDVAAGRDGVLVAPSRSLTRDGVFNAVKASGDGSTDVPVSAVAIDDGANSPTRFGGPFGQVPRFYSSPLITTGAQALSAAQKVLRRNLGLPHQVSFGAVANPTLRPRQAIRITYQDHNREKHIVETCTIPLSAQAAVSAQTREQTLIAVGSLT